VEPKPSLIVKLRNADVLIEGGADLEIGWLPALVDRSGNRKIQSGPGRIKANEGVKMLEVPGTMDRSQGDLHAAGNPHFMVDPANAEIVARHFAEVFSRLDPNQASHYASGLDQFLTRLKGKLKEWEETLAPFKGQTVVGYHSAWPYFAHRFGLKIDLFLEPKPGLPATPAHLAEVISEMKKRGAKVVIVDAYLDRRTAEVVANRTGAVVVDVTHFPGGVKGTEAGYIPMMDYLVNAMAKGLRR
jgi:zinc/manganese transport system substrate-binding protein